MESYNMINTKTAIFLAIIVKKKNLHFGVPRNIQYYTATADHIILTLVIVVNVLIPIYPTVLTCKFVGSL